MPAPLLLRPVVSRADASAFLDLPRQLHRADPCWVPPLRRAERLRWSPRHNAVLAGLACRRWLAWRGDRPVARLAAVDDPAFAATWLPRAGLFGFLEAEDDREAVAALLDRAGGWLAARGRTAMVGPVNLTLHDECGVLVEGGDRPPMLLTAWNPPWYGPLLEAAGCAPLRAWVGYRWRPASGMSPAARRAVRAAASAYGGRLVVRRPDPARWDSELARLRTVWDACFADEWGFQPLDDAAFAARAREFRRIFRPELAAFAEVDGEPVGFGLALPDVNVGLAAARGRLLPLGWLRLALALRRPKRVRLLLLGVRPEHRARGIGAILSAAIADGGREIGVEEAELSLVREENGSVRQVIEAFGGERARRWVLYRRELRA